MLHKKTRTNATQKGWWITLLQIFIRFLHMTKRILARMIYVRAFHDAQLEIVYAKRDLSVMLPVDVNSIEGFSYSSGKWTSFRKWMNASDISCCISTFLNKDDDGNGGSPFLFDLLWHFLAKLSVVKLTSTTAFDVVSDDQLYRQPNAFLPFPKKDDGIKDS